MRYQDNDMVSNLDCALNRGHRQTNVIIMDFTKAFDKVPYRRLFFKLDYYGIRGSTNKWISSWLSYHSQKVVLDGQASDLVFPRINLRSGPFSYFY